MTLVARRPRKKRAVTVDEISKIAPGMVKLLDQIWPLFTADEVGLIVGDDTSGRIPALMVAQVVNRARRSAGRERLPVIFVPGTKDDSQAVQQRSAFEACSKTLDGVPRDKRVLIVTEGITGGRSIASIGRLLAEHGLHWDVAALDGASFTPRTPAGDEKVAADAIEKWQAKQARHEARVKELTHAIAERRDHLDEQIAACSAQISHIRTESEKERATLLQAAQELEEAPPFKGLMKWDREFDRRRRIRELCAAADLVRPGASLVDLEYRLAALQNDETLSRLTAELEEVLANAVADPDIQQLLDRDPRAIWPDDTRFFAGGLNAGPIRDRSDLSGISQDKFAEQRVVRGRYRARAVKTRLAIGEWSEAQLDRMAYQGRTVPFLIPSITKLVDAVRPEFEGPGYSIIIGDDTSGRIPTLMIARTINQRLMALGRPKVPVRFIEGIKQKHHSGQAAAFERLMSFVGEVDRSQRALIVTDNVANGLSVGSIAWCLDAAGIASDVATLAGPYYPVQHYRSSGHWPRTTRGYGARSNDAARAVIDKPRLCGLRQREPKFTPGLVAHGDDIRRTAIATRSDIAYATRRVAGSLVSAPMGVSEIATLMPGLAEATRVLRDAVHADQLGAIVGEDPAGRVPAVVIGAAVNRWRRDHGMHRLPVFFVPAPTKPGKNTTLAITSEDLDRRYRELLDSLAAGRTLLCTGALHSGTTTGVIAHWLAGHGAGIDIIAPRKADKSQSEYVADGTLPEGSRILTQDSVAPFDRTKRGLYLWNHPEVNGVVYGETGWTHLANPNRRREVAMARRMIRDAVPQLAAALE